ncbi:MAG: magnesium transporter [Planctomycetales bacterium]|nr:magnesium transporter [Planctomycetales bacterium]
MEEPAAPTETELLQRITQLANDGSQDELETLVESLPASDLAFAVAHLDEAEIQAVLGTLPAEAAAGLLSQLSDAQAAGVIAQLTPAEAATILQEMGTDEQADLIQELDEARGDAILEQLPAQEASEVRELAAYDDDVAGGLMSREFIALPVNATVRDVLVEIERALESMGDGDARYGYVVDDQQRLVGVLPMQNLLFVRRSTVVRDVMIPEPMTVRDDASLDELSDVFESRAFLGIPVVDEAGVLRGVVQRDTVHDAEYEAAESDYMKSQGIVSEELRTMPVWTRARRRLSWLSVNILLNLGAASVIAVFQDTLQAVIALAVFLPIISDMSGCSGNQAVAVSMRELSLGLVRPGEIARVWLQEISVGLINGAVLGVLVALAAIVYDGNPLLGMVVGVALFLNTVVAVSIGGTVPLVVKRLGFDPAIASGPLLTTITDMCGFFFVLGIASTMLERLAS